MWIGELKLAQATLAEFKTTQTISETSERSKRSSRGSKKFSISEDFRNADDNVSGYSDPASIQNYNRIQVSYFNKTSETYVGQVYCQAMKITFKKINLNNIPLGSYIRLDFFQRVNGEESCFKFASFPLFNEMTRMIQTGLKTFPIFNMSKTTMTSTPKGQVPCWNDMCTLSKSQTYMQDINVYFATQKNYEWIKNEWKIPINSENYILVPDPSWPNYNMQSNCVADDFNPEKLKLNYQDTPETLNVEDIREEMDFKLAKPLIEKEILVTQTNYYYFPSKKVRSACMNHIERILDGDVINGLEKGLVLVTKSFDWLSQNHEQFYKMLDGWAWDCVTLQTAFQL